MQDPIIQQLIGQNPQAQMLQGAMMAHIAEHVGFAYRNKIELALGVSLPNPEDEMPPAMEKEISRLMAEAATQVLAESKVMAAQQQAQQNAQDPVLQMQMQELEIKKQELQLRAQKIQIDGAAKADELNLKKQEMEARAEMDIVKLKAEAERHEANQQLEGARLGVDIAKSKDQMRKAKEPK
jgi:hypothetical protein